MQSLLILGLAWPAGGATLTSQQLRLPVVSVSAPQLPEGSSSRLLADLGIAPGSPISVRQLDLGLKKINASEKYRDLSVTAEVVSAPRTGLRVTLQGALIKRLAEVQISGAEADIVEAAGISKELSTGRQGDPRSIAVARERLKDALENSGYYFSTVQISTSGAEKEDQENLDIKIDKGPATKVSKISFTGVDSASDKNLRELLKIQTGDVLDKKRIDDSIRAIQEYFISNQYLTSSISPPQIRFSDDRLSAAVVFPVVLASRYQFQFSGSSIFDAPTLRGFMNKDILTQSDASSKIALLIEEKYREIGFHFVTVEATLVTQVNDKSMLVKFDIKEGPKVLIDKVEFDGVWDQEAGNAEKLFYGNAPGVVRRKVYWEKGLDDAGKNFTQALRTLGFLNASLVGPRVVFSEDKKGARLFYDLQLGSQYQVSAIHFEGAKNVAEPELREALALYPGEVANRERLTSGAERLKDFYLSKGYLDATVSVEEGAGPSLRERREGMEVKYRIVEGRKYFVGDITIEGNHRTQEKVIRREILLVKADAFDPSKLRQSEENISVLGLFSRVESVSSQRADDPSVRDIRILVNEVKPGFGEVGLGAFYEDPRFRLKTFLGLGYKNLFGLNQTATLRSEVRIPISRRQELIPFVEYATILGYRAPYLAGLPFTFAASLGMDSFEVQSTTTDSTLQTRARIEERIEKKFSKRFTGIYRLHRLERIRTETKLVVTPDQNVDDITNIIGSTGPGIILDLRNEAYNPTSGSYHSLDVEFAHPYLLSNPGLGFVMGIWKNSFYFPIADGFNLALFGGFGVAHAFLEKPVPEARLATEMALGGQGSIRGYSLGRFRSGKEVKDTAYYNARAELTMAVYGNLGMAVFFDTGQLYPNWAPQKRYDGIGLGLRYKTPVGPVVIDVAHALSGTIKEAGKPDEEEVRLRFYFTVGSI